MLQSALDLDLELELRNIDCETFSNECYIYFQIDLFKISNALYAIRDQTPWSEKNGRVKLILRKVGLILFATLNARK